MSASIKIVMMILSIAFIFITFDRFMTVEGRQHEERAYIIRTANVYIDHGIYQRAIPIVRSLISTEPTIHAASNRRYQLMNLYYSLGNTRAYRNTLMEILDIGVAPYNMPIADLYLKLFYLEYGNTNIRNIIELLRRASSNTGDSRLVDLFENYRFHYTTRRTNFDYIGVMNINNAVVARNGYYGFINAVGNTILEPQFELVTNFSGNYAVVQTDDVLEIINRAGIRQAIADFNVTSISYFNGNSFVHSMEEYEGYFIGMWPSGSLTFYRGYDYIDFIGALSYGIRVFRRDYLYSVFGDFIYESVAIDELGRAAVNGRVFVNSGNGYYMKDLNGNIVVGSFEDAKPFFETGGLAAVKRGGLWGFINNAGEVVVDFIYEDAQSSSFNLAGVKKDGLWGFIALTNDWPRIVIEPQFEKVNPFVGGMASGRTYYNWVYIILTGGY